MIELKKSSKYKINLIGIDNSTAMLEHASKKAKAFGVDIKLINDDIFNVELKDARVVLMKR